MLTQTARFLARATDSFWNLMVNDMQRVIHLVALASLLALPTLASGCASSSVGDPCDPENVPSGGFNASEAYLETSSVQCRTRVCMVYHLAGDTSDPNCDPLTDPSCPSPVDVEQRVYCTCRCDAPAGSNTPTCGCPGGYTCAPVLQLGGDGIRGSYCVKTDTVE